MKIGLVYFTFFWFLGLKLQCIPSDFRKDVDSGAIAKGAIDEIGHNARTVLSQYFKFVKDIENPPKLMISHLLNQVKVQAFIKFMDKRNVAPNTVGNRAKSLIEVFLLIFFSFSHTRFSIGWRQRKNLQRISPRLRQSRGIFNKVSHTYFRYLSDVANANRKRRSIETNNAPREEQLQAEGKFMDAEEVKSLYSKLLEILSNFIEIENNDDDEGEEMVYEDALYFQRVLLTLCSFTFGAQRRQVVNYFTLKVYFLYIFF